MSSRSAKTIRSSRPPACLRSHGTSADACTRAFFALALGKTRTLRVYSLLDRPSDSDMVRKAIEHYLPNIWRYALAISGDSDKADDLTQATCLRAIEKSHQFRSGQKPVGWFITICRSVWLNQLRSDKVRAEASMDRSLAPDLIDRSSDTEMTVMAHKVFAKVMELPDAQRETVTLVYVEGFTYREAAEILNVPVGTVMSRLAVARKKLWWLAASAFDDDRNVVSR